MRTRPLPTPTSAVPTAQPTAAAAVDAGHPQRWAILAVMCVSLVLIVAANSGLNVALPTLVRQLGATQTQLQWIVDAYALVFAGLVLPAGALGDRFGRKQALQVGLAVFAAGAVAAPLAASPGPVIAARAVMGLGSALVMPATLSILTVAFAPRDRGRAIGIWAAFAGAGAAVGPIMSGLLLEWFSWGSVFFVNLPIIAVAMLAGARLVPTSRDTRRRPLDLPGVAWSVLGLAALLFGIIEGPARGWTDPATLTGLGAGAVFLATFALWERHTDQPMLDPAWFADPRFATGAASITLTFFTAFGLFFVLTQYLQFALGYTPLAAGLAGLPVAASQLFVAERSDTVAQRISPRGAIAVGLAILAGGLAWLAAVATTDAAYLTLLPALVGIGAGLALAAAPATALIMSALPTDRAGVGSAVNDTTRELGGALGVAILGSVLAALYRTALPTDQLPAPAAATARESIGAALAIADDTALGAALADAARAAFVDGFRAALLAAAITAAIAAAAIHRLGPTRHDTRDRHHQQGAPR